MKSKKKIIPKSKCDKNKQNESFFYRIIFLGDSGVGKTQIINVYNNKLFQNEHFPTFGIDFQIKTLSINGKKANIHCIDTDSSDFSQYTGTLFIKKADVFLLVYDITSRESFNNLHKYYNIFKSALNDLEDKYNNKILYLIGNKYDLKINRIINENEARDLAKKYNAKYMEVSAKNRFNIDRLFEYIIQDILRREGSNSSDSGGNVKNKSIYRNNMSIRYNDNLRNNNNKLYTENESRQNFETNSYFLQTRNYINTNNDYINNINKFQNIEELQKSYNYYQNENKPKICLIF